jgi:hypothetical protein
MSSVGLSSLQDMKTVIIESIGWLSTALFLVSIVVPQRVHLHMLGIATSITTGIYAYSHGATAIWVKWVLASGFHAYMWYRTSSRKAALESR